MSEPLYKVQRRLSRRRLNAVNKGLFGLIDLGSAKVVCFILQFTPDSDRKYVFDEKLFTYILKNKNEIAGYFELILNHDTKETEIVYFGILEEYYGMKLGGYLLSEAIKFSFNLGCQRIWVHTCSLDHKNALHNYQSRGMKIFKSEILIR